MQKKNDDLVSKIEDEIGLNDELAELDGGNESHQDNPEDPADVSRSNSLKYTGDEYQTNMLPDEYEQQNSFEHYPDVDNLDI